jgi:hypothetical protein
MKELQSARIRISARRDSGLYTLSSGGAVEIVPRSIEGTAISRTMNQIRITYRNRIELTRVKEAEYVGRID